MTNGRAREWCFTLNNYSSDDVERFKTLTPRYLIFGYEVCPHTGTDHLQGYVVFKDTKTMSAVKKYFDTERMHLEVRYPDSSPKAASAYCKKSGHFYEYGELPQQGKRGDLEDAMNVVRETGRMRDVVDIAKTFQVVRMAEMWLRYNDKPRNRVEPVYVWWFYGKSGTGKTTAAHNLLESLHKGDVYSAGDIGKWFDGYDGHECVLFDELRPDVFSFRLLLKFLDRDSVKVETKGGSRQFRGRYIVITTPYLFSEFVPVGEEPYQLERRIYQQVKFETLTQNLVVKMPLGEGDSLAP